MEDSLPSQSETPTSKCLDLPHDRLSELPNLALTRILSHLFFHEALKTSILSKRFYLLWNSISILNFSDTDCRKYDQSFVT
ncbi:hypothetical protein RDABS01_037477 [Bienertia sinuspersici]